MLYHQYEAALTSNDVPTLNRLFWDSPQVVRFGVGENLYGGDEIKAFRQRRPPTNLAREMLRLQVVTFGADCGSVTLEFRRPVNGIPRLGRQSQMGYRFPDIGWKIVSAYVSFLEKEEIEGSIQPSKIRSACAPGGAWSWRSSPAVKHPSQKELRNIAAQAADWESLRYL
ncbi:AtzH-like domain-containing protein [Thermostichus sp. OS-CIW-30]